MRRFHRASFSVIRSEVGKEDKNEDDVGNKLTARTLLGCVVRHVQTPEEEKYYLYAIRQPILLVKSE